MSKTLLVTAALILLINQFILDRALTDWIYNFVEKYWYWGIWVLVVLISIIGDRLLKASSSSKNDVNHILEKIDEIYANLYTLRKHTAWAGRNNQPQDES